MNNERKKIKNKFKLILVAKCIIDLIHNFKGQEEFIEDENIDQIENENKKIIANNANVFNEIGLNLNEKKIEETKLDELYIKIIKNLINLYWQKKAFLNIKIFTV